MEMYRGFVMLILKSFAMALCFKLHLLQNVFILSVCNQGSLSQQNYPDTSEDRGRWIKIDVFSLFSKIML